MIDLYTFELTLKMERQRLDQESARQAARQQQAGVARPRSALRVRRWLALALLALADRLDPRPVVSAAHLPGRPVLNGTGHHA
ncbi:MAG: hypothetical protein AB7K36_03525 [Chloroflexota bacterium]